MHDPSARVPGPLHMAPASSWWRHWGCRRIGGWGCWWCNLSQVRSEQACQLCVLVEKSCFHEASLLPAVAAPPWWLVQQMVSCDGPGPAAEDGTVRLTAPVSLSSQSLWSADCRLRRGATPRNQAASGVHCLLAVVVTAPWRGWVVSSVAVTT